MEKELQLIVFILIKNTPSPPRHSEENKPHLSSVCLYLCHPATVSLLSNLSAWASWHLLEQWNMSSLGSKVGVQRYKKMANKWLIWFGEMPQHSLRSLFGSLLPGSLQQSLQDKLEASSAMAVSNGITSHTQHKYWLYVPGCCQGHDAVFSCIFSSWAMLHF